jgi:hypothetical protein
MHQRRTVSFFENVRPDFNGTVGAYAEKVFVERDALAETLTN